MIGYENVSFSVDSYFMESRAVIRRRLFKAGTIGFGAGQIDCIIKNLSESGAGLEVTTPLYIPDRFTLFLQSDNSTRRCRVVWRERSRIGAPSIRQP